MLHKRGAHPGAHPRQGSTICALENKDPLRGPKLCLMRNSGHLDPSPRTEIPFFGHSNSQRVQRFYQKLGLGEQTN